MGTFRRAAVGLGLLLCAGCDPGPMPFRVVLVDGDGRAADLSELAAAPGWEGVRGYGIAENLDWRSEDDGLRVVVYFPAVGQIEPGHYQGGGGSYDRHDLLWWVRIEGFEQLSFSIPPWAHPATELVPVHEPELCVEQFGLPLDVAPCEVTVSLSSTTGLPDEVVVAGGNTFDGVASLFRKVPAESPFAAELGGASWVDGSILATDLIVYASGHEPAMQCVACGSTVAVELVPDGAPGTRCTVIRATGADGRRGKGASPLVFGLAIGGVPLVLRRRKLRRDT